ncbi:hypothetical protein [Streptomyces sp. GESEQ-35]|uniref:hypothetical protein n=1 Tax=Streptomyces sp. GESEQ-35 TaxID=2812657 RepID=UPI001B3443B0|nr:hypothetical protein [Streptomyces sp. GESEQ-35]
MGRQRVRVNLPPHPAGYGLRPWIEQSPARARTELAATGQHTRGRAPATGVQLTPPNIPQRRHR